MKSSKKVEVSGGQFLVLVFHGNVLLASKFERDIIEQMLRQLENMDVNEKLKARKP